MPLNAVLKTYKNSKFLSKPTSSRIASTKLFSLNILRYLARGGYTENVFRNLSDEPTIFKVELKYSEFASDPICEWIDSPNWKGGSPPNLELVLNCNESGMSNYPKFVEDLEPEIVVRQIEKEKECISRETSYPINPDVVVPNSPLVYLEFLQWDCRWTSPDWNVKISHQRWIYYSVRWSRFWDETDWTSSQD